MQAVSYLKSSCWSLCSNSSRSTGKSPPCEFKHSMAWSFQLLLLLFLPMCRTTFSLGFSSSLKMQEESRQEEELWAALQGEANQGSCLWIAFRPNEMKRLLFLLHKQSTSVCRSIPGWPECSSISLPVLNPQMPFKSLSFFLSPLLVLFPFSEMTLYSTSGGLGVFFKRDRIGSSVLEMGLHLLGLSL